MAVGSQEGVCLARSYRSPSELIEPSIHGLTADHILHAFSGIASYAHHPLLLLHVDVSAKAVRSCCEVPNFYVVRTHGETQMREGGGDKQSR